MYRLLYVASAIVMVWIVILVNKLLPVPLHEVKPVFVNPAFTTGKPFANADTLSYAFVYLNLRNHFSKPELQDVIGGYYLRDDNGAERYYTGLSAHQYIPYQEAGSYGMALIYKQRKNYELMLDKLESIKQTDKPFYHCERGWALAWLGRWDEAIAEFKKELTYPNGNSASANVGLAELYNAREEMDSIHARIGDPVFLTNCPKRILIKDYFLHGSVIPYLALTIKLHGSWDIIAAALFISLLWGYYYTRYKLFGPKNYLLYAGVFLFACILTPFCIIFYHAFHYLLDFTSSKDAFPNLLYSIFGIGLIEEFTKTIPVLICILFIRNVKEPVDALLLATFSALGFAFMENILYFDRYFGEESYSIIHDRSILSVIMHVFCSTAIWYGYMRARLRKHVLSLIVCILVSIIAHGFYDFFLDQSQLAAFYMVSFIMVIISFFALKIFYNDLLNQSPLFQPQMAVPTSTISSVILLGLSSVILFEFILNAIRFGAPHANDTLLSSLLGFVVLVLIYSSNLTRTVLSRNHWIKLRDVFRSGYTASRTPGSSVQFVPSKKTRHPALFPLQGSITGLEDFNGESQNYLVRLTTPILHNAQTIYTILAVPAHSTSEENRIHTQLFFVMNEQILQHGRLTPDHVSALDAGVMESASTEAAWYNRIYWNWKWTAGMIGLYILLAISFISFNNYTSSIEYLRGAQGSLEHSDLYMASERCKASLYFNEDNLESRMMLAKMYMQTGFYRDAVELLNVEFSIPDYMAADYYAVQGKALYKLQDYPSAIEAFTSCESYGKTSDSLFWFQSVSYENIQKLPEATHSMKSFLDGPHHVSETAYKRIAALYMADKKYADAVVYYDKLIAGKETYAFAYLQRGICLHHMGRQDASCTDLATANSYGDSQAIHYLTAWCGEDQLLGNE